MNEELSASLAETLRAAHEAATQASEDARSSIDTALNKAADAGLIVEEARAIHHGGLHEWLRKHVPTLSVEQAEVYRGIHRVRSRRQCLEADTRQLKLIGIIGEEETGENASSTAQRADGSRWIKWTGHVVHHFRELEQTRPLEKWDDFERKALADQLQPIVELWGRAKGVKVAI